MILSKRLNEIERIVLVQQDWFGCFRHSVGLPVCSYIRRGESHWWMKGSTPPQIAEIIIKLVKDMAAVSKDFFNP